MLRSIGFPEIIILLAFAWGLPIAVVIFVVATLVRIRRAVERTTALLEQMSGSSGNTPLT